MGMLDCWIFDTAGSIIVRWPAVSWVIIGDRLDRCSMESIAVDAAWKRGR